MSINLKESRNLGMVNENWLQIQVNSCIITPSKRSSLSFEASKAGIGFSSLAMSPIWHLLPMEACLIDTENLLFQMRQVVSHEGVH